LEEDPDNQKKKRRQTPKIQAEDLTFIDPSENLATPVSDESSDNPSTSTSDTARLGIHNLLSMRKSEKKPVRKVPDEKPAPKPVRKVPNKKPGKPLRKPVTKKKPTPGMRIEVFWTKEQTKNGKEGFYKGVVNRVENGKVIVQYDNDPEGSIEEEEDFGGNKWRELDDEDP